MARGTRSLVDLIHDVKSEIVGKIERIDERVGEIESLSSAHEVAIVDEIAVHASTMRALSLDLDSLRATMDVNLQATRDLLESRSATLFNETSAARDEIGHTLDLIRVSTKEISAKIEDVAPSVRLHSLQNSPLSEFDQPAADFLNWSASWNGPLSEVGLYVNHPYTVHWSTGAARLDSVNERILEHPFTFAALADVPTGSRILDIGGGESTVAASLASFGYDVTVIEPRGYAFEHPNLTVFEGPIEDFSSVAPFDVVILLSTIEHLGLGHYDKEPKRNINADREAMLIVADLISPMGKLILTTPFGPAEVTELERIYDRDGLLALLAGWTIETLAVGQRTTSTTWEVVSNNLDDTGGDARVAMLVATPPSTS